MFSAALAVAPQFERPTAVMLHTFFDRLHGAWQANFTMQSESRHIVATTGGIVDPAELAAPPNAHLVDFADHDALMARAALVVGHGGHGTTMRALSHGLPIVGIPAKGADQVPITQLLEQWKVGRALPGEADATQIRAAAMDVLGNPIYRDEAAKRALVFSGVDGAELAASSIERVMRGA